VPVFRFLPPTARGCLFFALIFLNTLFWALPLFSLALIKLLTPVPPWRRALEPALMWVAQRWVAVNNLILLSTQRTEWVIEGVEGLERHAWYLVSSNHQSWADILTLQRAFHRRIPFLKFFIKRELIWVPILGLAWWALDLPFMKRYSKEFLARHPELKGKDFETTRKACRRFQNTPTTILNFLEGTRLSKAKQRHQRSPYRHLLRPRAGGAAMVVDAMGERLRSFLDVTVVYYGRSNRFWDFVCGRVNRVVVHVRELAIPQELLGGDYQGDPQFRRRFQAWVSELWEAKDERIEALLAEG
jgi:1-acyl-sn-glycerol-3-phosphate acyltransferase